MVTGSLWFYMGVLLCIFLILLNIGQFYFGRDLRSAHKTLRKEYEKLSKENWVLLKKNGLANRTINSLETVLARREKEIKLLTNELDKFKNMAMKDVLTGIFNKRALEEYVLPTVKSQLERGIIDNCVVAFMDVDDFKKVNDTLGHQKGDEALQVLSGILRAHTREYDYLIRFAGDEFIIFFVNSTLRQARHVLKRARKTYAEHCMDPGRIDKLVQLSFCFGLAETSGRDFDFENLLKQADDNLQSYKKKKNVGR